MVCLVVYGGSFFFFKQKTAYEMRISDWSSDVCSSDLIQRAVQEEQQRDPHPCSLARSLIGAWRRWPLPASRWPRNPLRLPRSTLAPTRPCSTISAPIDRKSVV